ncbi:MAG: YkvA family protein [Alphaproteobacteria bacterium]
MGDLIFRLRRDVAALALAMRDPRVPWLVKLLAAGVVAYALSPIDLIPDFIPVLGWLDDLVIVGLGLWLALRFMPPGLLAEYRDKGADLAAMPPNWTAAAIVLLVWVSLAVAAGLWLTLR